MVTKDQEAPRGRELAPIINGTQDHEAAIIRLAIDAIANRQDHGANAMAELKNLSRELSTLIATAEAINNHG